MVLRHLPAAVALQAEGEALAVGPRRDAVEQEIADHVGLVVERGVTGKARELEVDGVVALLQRADAEVGVLPLPLVEDAAVPLVEAEHGEVRNLERHVGNLEGGVHAAGDEAQPRVVVDQGGDLREPLPLVGIVMDGTERRRRVLDAEPVVQELSGDEVVDLAIAAAVGAGGLRIVARAAGDREIGAGIAGARLHPDVDDARRAQAVLRRQRPGQQRHRVDRACHQELAEARQAVRQLHAVEPVLQVAVVAAHVDLAETVLHHARRAQQHLVQGRVLAQRHVLDEGLGEVVDGGAETGLDGAARLVQPFRGDGDAEIGTDGRLRLALGKSGRSGREAISQRCPSDMPLHRRRPLSPFLLDTLQYNILRGQHATLGRGAGGSLSVPTEAMADHLRPYQAAA